MATSTDLRAAIEEVQNQLPEGQLDGELEGAYEADFATKLEQRVGALPWWVISAVVHSVIFLLATLLTVALPQPQIDEVTITADVARKEQPEYDPKKKRDIFKNPQDVEHETQVENPVVVHEQTEVTDHFETENEMDNQSARGQEDAISDIPLGGTGVTGSMGVGGGGMAGCFGYRDGGGRKRAVARFGGSPATESAVEAALRWLARHQEKNGSWIAQKWDVTNLTEEKDHQVNVGCTALAALAFLGAGHTHKVGKFRGNVDRALKWLMARQIKNGRVLDRLGRGRCNRPGYPHAIAGLALAEAYGMTKDPKIRVAAQRAVDYSIKKHQKPYSGWRYTAGEEGDTSVTDWFVMQLKSARIAGLRVDNAGFQGAQNFLRKVTDRKTGRAKYNPGSSFGSKKHGATPCRTSIAMVCQQFMGTPNTDPLLVKAGKYLATPGNLPDYSRGASYYYWYYGTLGMFQMGGNGWQKWNRKMKSVLVDNQRRGGPMDGSKKDVDGSWDPIRWPDPMVGRAYTTALGALTLEVYYRYLPMYAK